MASRGPSSQASLLRTLESTNNDLEKKLAEKEESFNAMEDKLFYKRAECEEYKALLSVKGLEALRWDYVEPSYSSRVSKAPGVDRRQKEIKRLQKRCGEYKKTVKGLESTLEEERDEHKRVVEDLERKAANDRSYLVKLKEDVEFLEGSLRPLSGYQWKYLQPDDDASDAQETKDVSDRRYLGKLKEDVEFLVGTVRPLFGYNWKYLEPDEAPSGAQDGQSSIPTPTTPAATGEARITEQQTPAPSASATKKPAKQPWWKKKKEKKQAKKAAQGSSGAPPPAEPASKKNKGKGKAVAEGRSAASPDATQGAQGKSTAIVG